MSQLGANPRSVLLIAILVPTIALTLIGSGTTASAAPPVQRQSAATASLALPSPLRGADKAATPPRQRSTAAAMPAGNAAARANPVTFTGTRAETETFIRYYKTIHLTPQQERVKVEALAALRAPCCAENPLSTCCCPCNLAKAAWGLSAWLITEKGYGVEQVREAAKTWLGASNPQGFTGNACHTGGCARPMHQNGCGGMDDAQVL